MISWTNETVKIPNKSPKTKSFGNFGIDVIMTYSSQRIDSQITPSNMEKLH